MAALAASSAGWLWWPVDRERAGLPTSGGAGWQASGGAGGGGRLQSTVCSAPRLEPPVSDRLSDFGRRIRKPPHRIDSDIRIPKAAAAAAAVARSREVGRLAAGVDGTADAGRVAASCESVATGLPGSAAEAV